MSDMIPQNLNVKMWTLKTDINIPLFLENVKKCASDVYFFSEEGDILNLKSSLSQFVFTMAMCSKDICLSGKIGIAAEKDEKILLIFLDK